MVCLSLRPLDRARVHRGVNEQRMELPGRRHEPRALAWKDLNPPRSCEWALRVRAASGPGSGSCVRAATRRNSRAAHLEPRDTDFTLARQPKLILARFASRMSRRASFTNCGAVHRLPR